MIATSSERKDKYCCPFILKQCRKSCSDKKINDTGVSLVKGREREYARISIQREREYVRISIQREREY